MILFGIDPGASGGIAWWDSAHSTVDFDGAVPMPATEFDILEALRWTSDRGNAVAVLEKVHSRPGEGVSSAFKFGWSYGGLRMAILASGMRLEEVTPHTWQKALGITKRKEGESKSAFKARLKARAQELFPGGRVTLKTADALLILEYARRRLHMLENRNDG